MGGLNETLRTKSSGRELVLDTGGRYCDQQGGRGRCGKLRPRDWRQRQCPMGRGPKGRGTRGRGSGVAGRTERSGAFLPCTPRSCRVNGTPATPTYPRAHLARVSGSASPSRCRDCRTTAPEQPRHRPRSVSVKPLCGHPASED